MRKEGWLDKLDGYTSGVDIGYWFIYDDEEKLFQLWSYKNNGRVDYYKHPTKCAVQQRSTLNKGKASWVIRQPGGKRTTTKCTYAIYQAIIRSSREDIAEPRPMILPGEEQTPISQPIFESEGGQ